ncbi:hypothetical protein Q0F99_10435 [Rathayibacter oskolensis]|uniref:hypothetical protein n=1 Tax=Rathayibacter oskolensis TaxID=1891671 RepID=UPI00265DA930|nr:hypothetical protein [Rathayibacter oskolensis]WKK70317.1 hypothetical protein Q0F99_10435 [Rathayibacter oskolensis]
MTEHEHDTATATEPPPRIEEYEFEQDGRTAILRYAPEDSSWSIFTPEGIFIAALTRNDGDGSPFRVEGYRTGPVADEMIAEDPDWRVLVLRVLDAAEHFEP